MTKQPWPKNRREELDKLRQLVRVAGQLNHGNHIVEHIQELERLADELRFGEISKARNSFLDWLEKEATGQ